MNTPDFIVSHPMNSLRKEDARYEIKFAGRVYDRDRVLVWLKTHAFGFRVAYPSRRINNIYFDSHNLSTFTTNLSGDSARSKYRLRWYGETMEPEAAVYEQKVRRNKLGFKIAFPINKMLNLRKNPWHQVCDTIKNQLPPEQRLLANKTGQPIILTRYHREYFVSNDNSIRITLDTDHTAYDQRQASMPNLLKASNTPSPLIVEVKFGYGLEQSGQEVVKDIPLRISRHSKYMVSVSSIL